MRPRWPVPKTAELSAYLSKWDTITKRERIERLAFLWREFGDPDDLGLCLIGGIVASFAIIEIHHSFIKGNYVAAILLCQTFAEHQLAAHYAMSGQDKHVRKGFKDLIDQSLADGKIGANAAKRLQQLRIMRNPYTHHRLLNDPTGLLPRLMKSGGDPYKMAKADAQKAIQIVVDLIRDNSPDWRPHSS
jgi:hypothetical protein